VEPQGFLSTGSQKINQARPRLHPSPSMKPRSTGRRLRRQGGREDAPWRSLAWSAMRMLTRSRSGRPPPQAMQRARGVRRTAGSHVPPHGLGLFGTYRSPSGRRSAATVAYQKLTYTTGAGRYGGTAFLYSETPPGTCSRTRTSVHRRELHLLPQVTVRVAVTRRGLLRGRAHARLVLTHRIQRVDLAPIACNGNL